jgi:hypothetical protein
MLVFISCGKKDDSLEVWNNTSDTLYFCIYENDSLEHFNDNEVGSNYLNWLTKRDPQTSYSELIDGEPNKAWKEYVKKYCKDEKMRLWVFKQDVLLNNKWKDVIDNKLYFKKYILSYDTLEKLHWEIKLEEN